MNSVVGHTALRIPPEKNLDILADIKNKTKKLKKVY
jgi:hypothetical protein